jgi:SanA protein
VLVSGDHGHRDYDEVSAMGAALVRAGVPSNRVFLDHAGFRTLASMHRARVVFDVRDAAICSQRFHLPRSIYLARHFGIDAVGMVADRGRYRAETYNRAREAAARAAAFVDVLIGREASLLGPTIPISGDGRATHDRPL